MVLGSLPRNPTTVPAFSLWSITSSVSSPSRRNIPPLLSETAMTRHPKRTGRGRQHRTPRSRSPGRPRWHPSGSCRGPGPPPRWRTTLPALSHRAGPPAPHPQGLPGDGAEGGLHDTLGVPVHHPGHDLGVGAHVGGRDILVRPDDRVDAPNISPGEALELARGEGLRFAATESQRRRIPIKARNGERRAKKRKDQRTLRASWSPKREMPRLTSCLPLPSSSTRKRESP